MIQIRNIWVLSSTTNGEIILLYLTSVFEKKKRKHNLTLRLKSCTILLYNFANLKTKFDKSLISLFYFFGQKNQFLQNLLYG